MTKFTLLIIMMLCFNSGCNKQNFSRTLYFDDVYFKGKVVVEKIEKLDKYRISILDSRNGKTNCIYTPYEIFQFEKGDVNHDGKTDLCIGIIKPCPFDPVSRKRLFIYQIDHDWIRPLWLSSRLVHPMEKFKVTQTNDGQCHIRTIEHIGKDLYCLNEYNWESFGMAFIQKTDDSLSYTKACDFLNKQ